MLAKNTLADFQAPVRRSDISYLLDLTALNSSCVIVLKNPDANTKKRSENWHERHDEPKKALLKGTREFVLHFVHTK